MEQTQRRHIIIQNAWKLQNRCQDTKFNVKILTTSKNVATFVTVNAMTRETKYRIMLVTSLTKSRRSS